jgi:hypothetical protein
MLNHFEEKSFKNQLFHSKINISSQNILKVLQFYVKVKGFIKTLTLKVITKY